MKSFPLIGRRALGAGRTLIATPIKLNLFLEVVARRPDGFHDLETLFLALATGDRLVVGASASGEDTLSVEGHPAPIDRSNLVLGALDRARASRPIPPVAITLRKRIPAGTGLGAGSANAAGILAHLHDLHPDPRGREGVEEDAAALGSDLSFFLGDEVAAIGRGRGTERAPLPGRLFGGRVPAFILAIPALHSSTSAAFARMSFPLTDPGGPISVPTRTFEDSGEWQRGFFNRLEGCVTAADPRLRRLAEHLRCTDEAGPIEDGAFEPGADDDGAPRLEGAWLMSGSGSTFFRAVPDLRAAGTIVASLRAPRGALARFTAETGIPVTTRCALPHALILPR